MFNFLKKSKKKDLLQNWQIAIDGSFRQIINEDSIQFANADDSRVLYFSLLSMDSNGPLSADTLSKMQVRVTHENGSWQLKGARHGGYEVLICVFTYTDERDGAWMKDLFEGISFKG